MDYDQRTGARAGPQRVVTLLTPPPSIIRHTSHTVPRITEHKCIPTSLIPPHWHNECWTVKKEVIDKECLNCELCVSGKKAEIISAKCRKNNCKRRILTHCQENYEWAIKAYLWGVRHRAEERRVCRWPGLSASRLRSRVTNLNLSRSGRNDLQVFKSEAERKN